MFGSRAVKEENQKLEAMVRALEAYKQAISSGMAVIEFNPEGIVLEANDAFLSVVGYEKHQVIGQHHRMFCEEQLANSTEYTQFWQKLASGEVFSGSFQRVGSNGEPIWLEATYSPVIDSGKVTRIVKIALDVTQNTLARLSQKALLEALDKSMATIEFKPTGEVITANQNFCATTGYELKEIVGQHHKMFCEPEFFEQNPNFWRELSAGHAKSGQFKRKDKLGNTIWLEATYNPVLDNDGKVMSVIKFASNITQQMTAKSDLAQAANFAQEQTGEAVGTINKGVKAIQEVVDINHTISQELSKTSTSVENLNKQTDKIRDIVTTISDVADQTNLLALNAAIEAARAGEQGRGFAVVADEVRMLAARTSSSTIEIGEVVKNNIDLTKHATESMEKAQHLAVQGEEMTQSASSLIEEVREGTTKVSEVLTESKQKFQIAEG